MELLQTITPAHVFMLLTLKFVLDFAKDTIVSRRKNAKSEGAYCENGTVLKSMSHNVAQLTDITTAMQNEQVRTTDITTSIQIEQARTSEKIHHLQNDVEVLKAKDST